MQPYVDIALTGASSGLGRALAVALAHPGVSLHLAGRDAVRLAAVAATVRALGATATETAVDVTDGDGMAARLTGCGRLDLVIANAGISGGPGAANTESAAQVRAVFATNLDGVFNTVLPAMALLAAQPPGAGGLRGRVVVIGSIAGLIALPTSPSYSAAKAALDFWITASAPGAAKAGIGLTLVRPGFIHTPMTEKNPFPMPGVMDADAAAAKIVAGIVAGRTHITFPWWLGLFARFGQLLPKSAFARAPNKPAR
jgi:NAD(P)-dependent dehydrogenase (short-subunit alcohol dehydrogenase family)